MRFAYIDSQGKEVGIPTVEALQLRIELGAIVSSTMFFDASSDRWAPAREHEIFRTLQRELTDKDEGGFVAPPPALVEPPAPPAAEAESNRPPHPPESGPDFSEAFETLPELDLGTLPEDDRLVEKGSGLDVAGFTLTPLDDALQRSDALETTPPHGDPLESGFEITPRTAPDEPLLDLEPRLGEDVLRALEGIRLEGKEETGGDRFAPPSDLRLEKPLSQQDAAEPPAVAGPLELERPMSEYSPEGPPGWADEDAGSAPPGEAARRRAVSSRESHAPPARAAARASEPAQERRVEAPRRLPQSRPASARTRSPTSPAMLIATVFVLALVGGGGWFGWSLFHGRGTEESATRRYERVTIPTIAPELEARFRELADSARADLVRTMAIQAVQGLSPEPPLDWLGGEYLANASRYPAVAAYWTALNESLQGLRNGEEALFRQAFENRLGSTTFTPEERSALVERATAGFRSALPERDEVYDRLAAVFVSSLGLHEFLLDNEEDIGYEPATAGISRDPLLEAVPENQKLGDEMLRRVDMITAALEAMNALTDRVTTQRLFSLTFDKIAAIPVH